MLSVISEIKKAPEGAWGEMLKRFRIVRAGRLIQRGIHMSQIVWRDLVDVIVKPVGKQEIAMTAPGRPRFIVWIVIREVVVRKLWR